jgi:GNAT superfamily N-acetyltransferase
MNVTFRQAILPKELRALTAFDRRIFSASDRFSAAFWKECESWWMLVEGHKAGCCAFQRDVDFLEDEGPDALNSPRKGTLYITTTGLLPKYQGKGLGALLKAWEIAYARRHGFARIVTNTRRRNKRMVGLNKMFGFSIIRTTPRYYSGPVDAAVVMELRL